MSASAPWRSTACTAASTSTARRCSRWADQRLRRPSSLALDCTLSLVTDTWRYINFPEAAVGREETAQRLLTASTRRSYDPVVTIDWKAPFVPGAYWLP